MKKVFIFARLNSIILVVAFILYASVIFPLFSQAKDILSPEENLWLSSRNKTIVVYPEKNDPPFSYTSAGGNIQGLSIDYIELIAEKIGAKVQYLSPKSRIQILDELKNGKGDIVTGLTSTNKGELSFVFTDSYVTVPTVIVVRKDFEKSKTLTLNDFNGKRVSVVEGSALQDYISENYPRVILEGMTDDEVSLQQVVLGEVDAATMDIASLSFYLSKQVLNSVKVVGNTGFEYKPSFALSKDKAILQAILEKGMTQISTSERETLTSKWINIPKDDSADDFVSVIQNSFDINVIYTVLGIAILFTLILVLRSKSGPRSRLIRKAHNISELKKEITELAEVNNLLSEELQEVKNEEDKLVNEINTISK